MDRSQVFHIILLMGAFITILVLIWCHQIFCQRNQNYSTTTQRIPVKKNWNRKRSRPSSASPQHNLSSNKKQSVPHLLLISAYSLKPPLGFKYSTNLPQLDVSKTNGFYSHADAYPSTSKASYHSTPYPLFNLMPQPSTSRTACPPGTPARLRSETPDSTRSIPYSPTLVAAHPLFNSNITPVALRTSYSPELTTNDDSDCTNITPYLSAHEAPYPISSISAMTQHSSVTYLPEHVFSYEISDSTRNIPYNSSTYGAAYQVPNRSSLPQSATERSSELNAHYRRVTSYPPASTTLLSVEQLPPSYAEAVYNKF